MTRPDATLRFEGRDLPSLDALPSALAAADRNERAWLVRAAVVDSAWCAAMLDAGAALLAERDPAGRSAALAVAHALRGRALLSPVSNALSAAASGRPEGVGWLGVPDPAAPEQTLAQRALSYLIATAPPGHAESRAAIRASMGAAELRVAAWHHLGADEPDSVRPHLLALLTEAPHLAESVATRFALVHTAHCLTVAEALASLPLPTRRVFGDMLEKHLKRIFRVRLWAECRRALFGR